jgi:hypothetical protein
MKFSTFLVTTGLLTALVVTLPGKMVRSQLTNPEVKPNSTVENYPLLQEFQSHVYRVQNLTKGELDLNTFVKEQQELHESYNQLQQNPGQVGGRCLLIGAFIDINYMFARSYGKMGENNQRFFDRANTQVDEMKKYCGSASTPSQ